MFYGLIPHKLVWAHSLHHAGRSEKSMQVPQRRESGVRSSPPLIFRSVLLAEILWRVSLEVSFAVSFAVYCFFEVWRFKQTSYSTFTFKYFIHTQHIFFTFLHYFNVLCILYQVPQKTGHLKNTTSQKKPPYTIFQLLKPLALAMWYYMTLFLNYASTRKGGSLLWRAIKGKLPVQIEKGKYAICNINLSCIHLLTLQFWSTRPIQSHGR